MKINHCLLNGVKTYAFTSRKQLIEYACDQQKMLIAVNAEKILHATAQLREIINSNIGYADGEGAKMALKNHGHKDVVKIPGCELWLDLIRTLHISQSFYMIGAKTDVIIETVGKLQNQFPRINILNYRDGYINNEAEKSELINDVCEKKPDVVFVAMGSPRQEMLMNELMRYHKAVYMGLGGSFDVYTNKVKRAPKFFVRNHMEWLYRLMREPTRIKRQIHLARFAYMLAIGVV
jgi:UDP-N-acetyl-D-mannosaminouronate:lipid I N-acetyl-D-mannosaminouronosyltransferase